MLRTLRLGQSLRPKARWGFYSYPSCSSNLKENCNSYSRQLNNKLLWLFKDVDVILPSLYTTKKMLFDKKDATLNFVQRRVQEALRVGNGTKPVYAYLSLYENKTEKFLDEVWC